MSIFAILAQTDVIKIRISRWGHPGSRYVLNSMLGFLKRDRKQKTDRHRKGGNVDPEAEIGAKHPEASQCQGPPEAGRGQERFRPGSLGWSTAQLTP